MEEEWKNSPPLILLVNGNICAAKADASRPPGAFFSGFHFFRTFCCLVRQHLCRTISECAVLGGRNGFRSFWRGIKPSKAEEVRRGGKGERNGGAGGGSEKEGEWGGEGEIVLESPTRKGTLCNRQTTSRISCLGSNTVGPRCQAQRQHSCHTCPSRALNWTLKHTSLLLVQKDISGGIFFFRMHKIPLFHNAFKALEDTKNHVTLPYQRIHVGAVILSKQYVLAGRHQWFLQDLCFGLEFFLSLLT